MEASSLNNHNSREPFGRGRSVWCGGLKMAGGIPYWPARAKDLRYQPDIYARYGGDDGDCELAEPGLANHSAPLLPATVVRRTASLPLAHARPSTSLSRQVRRGCPGRARA